MKTTTWKFEKGEATAGRLWLILGHVDADSKVKVRIGFNGEVRELIVTQPEPRLPHSRACGVKPHEHGPACAKDCPTCEGGAKWLEPDEETES